jgi:hypothetical protein
MLCRVDWYSHRQFVGASCLVGTALFRNMHVLRSCVHLPISVQHNPTFNTPVIKTQELLYSISQNSLNAIPPSPSSLSKWTFHKRFPKKFTRHSCLQLRYTPRYRYTDNTEWSALTTTGELGQFTGVRKQARTQICKREIWGSLGGQYEDCCRQISDAVGVAETYRNF